MTTLKSIFAFTLLMLAMSSFTVAPPAATTGKTQDTQEFTNFQIYNQCTNEMVTLNGWFKVNIHWVQINGVYKTTYHYNYNMKGVGNTSGTEYQYKGNQNDRNASNSCSSSQTSRLKLRFSAKGNADDLIVNQLSSYSWDFCNSEFTSDYEYTTECK